MTINEVIITTRDCDGVLIPSGELITIPVGSSVFITQALGGSYTVNVAGNLARIAEQDADALGLASSPKPSLDSPGPAKTTEELVWEQLKDCYDPEIPINIVELGLVYECKISAEAAGGSRVDILMTLTAPGCGMGDFLAADIKTKILTLPKVTAASVEITFEPPWDQSMMSEAARLATGMY